MAITAYKHVTPAGAGAKTGADWTNAFGEPEFEAYIEGGGLAAGNVVFIKEGTYVLNSSYDSSAIAGTATAPIAFIGVKAGTTNVGAAVAYADWATGANRPFFDCVTWVFKVGTYYNVRNLYIQGDSTVGTLQGGNNTAVINCKVHNDRAASTAAYCISMNQGCSYIRCEIIAAKTRGINSGLECLFAYCYFNGLDDATNGFAIVPGVGSVVVGCVFNGCTFGMSFGAGPGDHSVVGNSFYGCGTAISSSTSAPVRVLNNIVEGNTVAGFKWTTQSDSNIFDGNHGNDARNTDMWALVDDTTVFKDQNVTTGDPLFTVPGTDHSLQDGSPCRSTAKDIMLGVGSTPLNGNKGAWQGRTQTATFPAAANVLVGTGVYGWAGEFTPVFTDVDPGILNVAFGTNYTINGVALVGAQVLGLAAQADVRLGVDRGDGLLGLLIVPGVGDVREGTAFDSVPLIGTLHLPAVDEVLLGLWFGAGSTEFMGTLIPMPPTPAPTPSSGDFYYDDAGYRSAFETDFFIRTDAEPVDAAVAVKVPRLGQITVDRSIESEYLQPGVRLRGAPWRLQSCQLWCHDIDEGASPTLKTMTEKNYQMELDSPSLWLARSDKLLLDYATARTLSGSYQNVTTGPDGKSRSAVVMGVSDDIRSSDIGAISGDFTLALWMKPPAGDVHIARMVTGSLDIQTLSGALHYDDDSNAVQFTPAFATAWVQLVVRRQGKVLTVFENGVLLNTAAVTVVNLDGRLTLFGGSLTWHDVRIYAQALTDDCIKYIYDDVTQHGGEAVEAVF